MKTEEKQKFDILDYLQKGETMYEKLDEYLGGYLKGDYSTNNLLDTFRDYSTDFKQTESDKTFIQKMYNDLLDRLISNIDLANRVRTVSDNVIQLTDKEKTDFLKELQSIDDDQRLPSIGAYLRLLKRKNFSEEYYSNHDFYTKLNRIVIDKGLEVSDDEFSKLAKKSILSVYAGRVANGLRKKYPDRSDRYYPEWEEFNFINQTFNSSKKLEEYDKLLSDYHTEIESYANRLAMQTRCKEKRKRYVSKALYDAMEQEEQEKAITRDAIDVVYQEPLDLKLGKSSHNWRIKLYNKPKYVCNLMAKYSNNGEENQRVVAVSYGIFESDSMFNQDNVPLAKDTMQFLGISRLGQDGIKNYFVLVPLKNVALMKAIELKEDEFEKDISIDEFRNILQAADGQNRNSLIYRIPQELEDYYATVAFSDYCLDKAVKQNSRFPGSVDVSRGKPRISAGYIEQARNIEAAWHACRYPGSIGGRVYASLEDFCRSTELLAKHIETVNEMTRHQKELYKGEIR